MIFRISAILALFSFSLFASDSGETDIVARTFNFVIFASILYYLIAEPLKKFLSDRTLSIENEFKRNERRLEESRVAKEEAEANLISAKRKAGMMVIDAKKEAQLIKAKLEDGLNSDLALLDKQQKELMEFDENQMVRSVVEEVIQNIVKDNNIGLDQETLTKTLIKKVS